MQAVPNPAIAISPAASAPRERETNIGRCIVISAVNVEAGENARSHAILRWHDRHVHGNGECTHPERHSRADRERDAGRSEVRSNAELELTGRPHPHEPGETGQEYSLIETADEEDPFVERDRAALDARELALDLPTELRYHWGNVDAMARPQRIHDAAAQPCDPETRAGTVDLPNQILRLLGVELYGEGPHGQ